MPADSRTGIEGRIVRRPLSEVKMAGQVARARMDCVRDYWAGAGGVTDSAPPARFASVT